MPFKSAKQRRWMFKNNPALARKWQKEYMNTGGQVSANTEAEMLINEHSQNKRYYSPDKFWNMIKAGETQPPADASNANMFYDFLDKHKRGLLTQTKDIALTAIGGGWDAIRGVNTGPIQSSEDAKLRLMEAGVDVKDIELFGEFALDPLALIALPAKAVVTAARVLKTIENAGGQRKYLRAWLDELGETEVPLSQTGSVGAAVASKKQIYHGGELIGIRKPRDFLTELGHENPSVDMVKSFTRKLESAKGAEVFDNKTGTWKVYSTNKSFKPKELVEVDAQGNIIKTHQTTNINETARKLGANPDSVHKTGAPMKVNGQHTGHTLIVKGKEARPASYPQQTAASVEANLTLNNALKDLGSTSTTSFHNISTDKVGDAGKAIGIYLNKSGKHGQVKEELTKAYEDLIQNKYISKGKPRPNSISDDDARDILNKIYDKGPGFNRTETEKLLTRFQDKDVVDAIKAEKDKFKSMSRGHRLRLWRDFWKENEKYFDEHYLPAHKDRRTKAIAGDPRENAITNLRNKFIDGGFLHHKRFSENPLTDSWGDTRGQIGKELIEDVLFKEPIKPKDLPKDLKALADREVTKRNTDPVEVRNNNRYVSPDRSLWIR